LLRELFSRNLRKAAANGRFGSLICHSRMYLTQLEQGSGISRRKQDPGHNYLPQLIKEGNIDTGREEEKREPGLGSSVTNRR